MPELPEVETTCRGIEPHIKGETIKQVIIRHPKLRWDIPQQLITDLPGLELLAVQRRSKYILLKFTSGKLLIHLGMSGSLRVLLQPEPALKHDHFELVFTDGTLLRLTDPRRFGAVLWQEAGQQHPLLEKLGPEPLTDDFNVDTFVRAASHRKIAIKQFIMDNKVVVGVGNIYAAEALFAAALHPETPVNTISKQKFQKLVAAIKYILVAAIERGGTTLKDFVCGDCKQGYFAQELQLYGRKGQTCNLCQSSLHEIRLGQRSTVYCSKCQRLDKSVAKKVTKK